MRTALPNGSHVESIDGFATGIPPSRKVAPSQRTVFGLASLVAVAALNIVWFTTFSGRTLMGDDLELLLGARSGGYASSFLGGFTESGADKFRPVLTPILAIVTDLFGTNFTAYRTLNLGLQLCNVALVGLIAWKLSKRSWTITVVAMILVTISRFNTYFVLQIYGLMEGLALAFLLAMVLAVLHAYSADSRRWLLAASLLYCLATFTHERYIVLGPFLLIATFLGPITFRNRWSRARFAAAPCLVAFSNVAVKAWVLRIHYFTGGGGQEVAFNPGEKVTFMRRGLMNVFGFNTGPDYLSGKNMHSLGSLGVVLGLLFAIPVVVLILGSMFRDVPAVRQGQIAAVRKYVLAVALLGPLLLGASITFRQEYRWLYAPFVVVVLGISWMLGRVPPGRRVHALLVATVFLGGVSVDGYYRRHVENTYFFSGLQTADSIRKEVLERHRTELDSTTVFLFTHDDPTLTGWYLRGRGLFTVYGPKSGSDIRLVTSVEAAQAAGGVRPKVLAFDYRPYLVVDVTRDFLRSVDRGSPVASEAGRPLTNGG